MFKVSTLLVLVSASCTSSTTAPTFRVTTTLGEVAVRLDATPSTRNGVPALFPVLGGATRIGVASLSPALPNGIAAIFTTTNSPQAEFNLYTSDTTYDQESCSAGVGGGPGTCVSGKTATSSGEGESFVGQVSLKGFDPPGDDDWRNNRATIVTMSYKSRTYLIVVCDALLGPVN